MKVKYLNSGKETIGILQSFLDGTVIFFSEENREKDENRFIVQNSKIAFCDEVSKFIIVEGFIKEKDQIFRKVLLTFEIVS